MLFSGAGVHDGRLPDFIKVDGAAVIVNSDYHLSLDGIRQDLYDLVLHDTLFTTYRDASQAFFSTAW